MHRSLRQSKRSVRRDELRAPGLSLPPQTVVRLYQVDHHSRQRRLREQLGRDRLDALLVTHLPNIRYLCGFTGSSAVLILTEERSVFFSDGRYIDQAKEEVQKSRIVIARQAPHISAAEWLLASRPRIAATSSLKKRGLILRIEGEHLTVAARSRLSKILGSAFKLKESPPLVERARMLKDPEEIKLLRAAVQMGASLFEGVLETIKPGVRENEVAAELEYAARQAGAQQMSFATIIASGKRSALPHGVASGAKIPARGFVVCDFGVILAGYCSDMTRTVHVGIPTKEARRVYELVRQAQQAAVDAVKPGISVSDVDEAARKLLNKHGLGRYFSHSTGHGVGLEIHEAPRMAAAQTDILRPGMVITIEPGAYIPQKWGVRIEDMVLVTETGCEVLTPTSKELITL
jgi:Xaa-Pro aminopeptidase